MFCGECGAKMEKNAEFCPECGKRVENQEQQVEVQKPVIPRKPMKKSTKIIIASVLIIVVVFACVYNFVSGKLSPESVSETYVEALIKNDTDKLYDYLSLEGDTTFASKDAFKEVMKDSNYQEIENYNITSVDYAEGGLTAEVVVKYTMKDSATERTLTIDLTKQKEKKYLFFDNWKVADSISSVTLVKDYEIQVSKDAEVYFADKKIEAKYKDEEDSNDYYDVYVLPQVFAVKAKVRVVLNGGLEMEEEVTPSTYYDNCVIKLELDNMKDDDKTEIQNSIVSYLNAIYKGILEDKKFADIKSSLGSHDLKELESSYNELVKDLGEDKGELTKINFTKVTLRDLELDDDGNIEVDIKADYSYSLKYTFFDEERTHDDTDSSYMTVILKYEDNSYKIMDIEDLEDYFSRY